MSLNWNWTYSRVDVTLERIQQETLRMGILRRQTLLMTMSTADTLLQAKCVILVDPQVLKLIRDLTRMNPILCRILLRNRTRRLGIDFELARRPWWRTWAYKVFSLRLHLVLKLITVLINGRWSFASPLEQIWVHQSHSLSVQRLKEWIRTEFSVSVSNLLVIEVFGLFKLRYKFRR